MQQIRIAFVFIVLLASCALPLSVKAKGSKPVQYYVSVGTSLAAGVQADKKTGALIVTEDAYTDQIHQRLRGQIPHLEHVKRGCPAETSQSLITGVGSFCYAPGASQLDVVEAFLLAHPGEIALITIDIGANDLLPCLSAPDLAACVASIFGQLQANLGQILVRLQSAAPGVPIIAINYYNPFLAAWLQGPEGEAIAVATNNLVLAINALLGQIYGAFGIPVADVAGAFATADFSPQGNLPHNVKTVCQLTWNCEYDNIHPNQNGYKVIARTVEQLMKQLGLLQTPHQGVVEQSAVQERQLHLPLLQRD